MAGLLAAQVVATFAHRFHDVAVAHIGLDDLAARFAQCYVQPHVAHDGCHQGLLFEKFALEHVAGADGHDVVAVHLVAEFIADDDPVGVSVQGDADIGAMLFDRFTDHRWTGRTAAGIDIGAVGIDTQRYYLGPQFFENGRSNLVGGAVGTVQHNLEAGEIHLRWKGVFEENDVAAGGVVEAESLADFGGGWAQCVYFVGFDQFLNLQFNRIRQFEAVGGKEFDAVVLEGVV